MTDASTKAAAIGAAAILARRLKMAADEIESAARYGVPIPSYWSISGHPTVGGLSFSASPEEFVAWVDYTEATVTTIDPKDADAWLSADADVNGLRVEFFVKRDLLTGDQLAGVPLDVVAVTPVGVTS